MKRETVRVKSAAQQADHIGHVSSLNCAMHKGDERSWLMCMHTFKPVAQQAQQEQQAKQASGRIRTWSRQRAERAQGRWKELRQLRTWQPRVAPLSPHTLHFNMRPRLTASGTPSITPSDSYTYTCSCLSDVKSRSNLRFKMVQYERATVSV